MIKVLIVDDEILVRVGLKAAIDWNSNGFEIVGEAANGREALKKIIDYQVDLLLLDIKMPIMNGIELLREMKKQNIKVKVIILSGYDDFEYVREAMKLGALDYLLKLSLKTDRLLAILNEIKINQIDKSEEIHVDKSIQITSNWVKLLYEYNQAIWEEQKTLGIHVEDAEIIVFAISIDYYEEILLQRNLTNKELLRKSIIGIINDIINDYATGDVIAFAYDKLIAFINPKNLIMDKILLVTDNIQKAIERYLQLTISIGVSEVQQSPRLLNIAYKQAYNALRAKFIYGKSSVVMYHPELLETPDQRNYFTSELEEKFTTGIEFQDAKKLNEVINLIISTFKKSYHSNKRDLYNSIDLMFYLFLKELKLYNKSLTDIPYLENESPFQIIRKFEFISDLQDWLLSFANNFLLYLIYLKSSIRREEISKAKVYIEKNYMNTISIEDIARYVNISENYFSHLFNKEVGQTFSEYLNLYRIQQAKLMLKSTELKVNEIANRVGYQNIYYFSTVFKKYVGMSPLEYRKIGSN